MNPSDFADAIAAQWHELYGPSRLEVPMSVLATAVLRQRLVIPAEEHTAAEGFLSGQRRVWEVATHGWPYLYHRWECFTDWPSWPDHHRTAQAATVFALRLRTLGVVEHLSSLTHGQDFLGAVLHRLRAPAMTGSVDPLSARRGVRLQSEMPVQTITLDQTGSGHQVLGVLTALSALGVDPKRVTWRLREIDELTAATLCVNLVVWQVADPERANVLVAISEDEDWIQAEQEARAEALQALYPPPFGF
ncbi:MULTISPECIES: hypothetical protein [unclassified Nocardiopsis]|uniref:hypothetical protein n=1 Tax=unclassified Nocardiopsis TaxID=2649073 RepID=UPI00135CC206|nr:MULTISPECIES: hypothetical protein [unclassified Nocardiopsis]